MASYISLVYSISGRSQLLGAAGWHQDTFIWCGRWVVGLAFFQTWQIFLRSFDVPTNDLFLVVARWYGGTLFPSYVVAP